MTPDDPPTRGGVFALAVACLLLLGVAGCRERAPMEDGSEPTRTEERASRAEPSGVDLLAEGEGVDAVARQCTGCHSARLIVQTRLDRDGWRASMEWMQEHHNLQAFAPDEEARILDYLATHYGASEGKDWSRRRPIPPELMPPGEVQAAEEE